MHSNLTTRNPEALRLEMVRTGKLLLDVLALEHDLAILYSRRRTDEKLRQWRNYRRAVRPLAEDYLRALARYRRAVRFVFIRNAA